MLVATRLWAALASMVLLAACGGTSPARGSSSAAAAGSGGGATSSAASTGSDGAGASGGSGGAAPSPACPTDPPAACEAVAPARCWYVAKTGDDAAAGSIDAPVRHIWMGLSKAKPGDFVYLRAGTWGQSEATAYGCGSDATQKAIVPIVQPILYGTGAEGEDCVATYPAFEIASGTPEAPITLAAFTGEHVILDGEQGDGPNDSPEYVVRIGGFGDGAARAYWTVRGFDVHGALFVTGNGFTESGDADPKANTHDIVIEGNDIHGVTTWGGNNPGMIKIDRGDWGGPFEITVRCNHIHDMKDNGTADWSITDDAQHYGAVTTLSPQIYFGIDKAGTGRVVIERNVIHALPHAFFFKNPAAGPIEIRDNRIFDTQALGEAGTSNMTFENNLVYATGGSFDYGLIDQTDDPALVPLAGQSARLEHNTMIGPGYGACGAGVGHDIHGNLVAGIESEMQDVNWDTPSLLAKATAQPDALDVAQSVLHTVSMDDNCYATLHADFQAVARYIPTGADFQVDHFSLDDARSIFGFDLASKVVVGASDATLFVDAPSGDYTTPHGSPCEGYGADLSQIPAAP